MSSSSTPYLMCYVHPSPPHTDRHAAFFISLSFPLVTDESLVCTTSPSGHVSLKTDINYASGEYIHLVSPPPRVCVVGEGSLQPKHSTICCLSPSAQPKDALTICWQGDHVQRTMFLWILTGQELKCVNCRPANLKC